MDAMNQDQDLIMRWLKTPQIISSWKDVVCVHDIPLAEFCLKCAVEFVLDKALGDK